MQTSNRSVSQSREEYEIVEHGCCTKLKNIKTHSELIATYESESCIVKIESVD